MNDDEPLPTRASLLDRLKNPSDDASWSEFDRNYRGLLTGVARRAGLNDHETAEVVQDTLIALARKIPEFRYQPGKDSFKGWLLQVLRWRIVDRVRRRAAARALEPATLAERLSERDDPVSHSNPTNVADPREAFASIWDAEWEEHLLKQALARVKRQANPEQYAIYHLREIEQRPVAEVRKALGVSAAAIYLASFRVGALLKREVRRLQESGFGL